MTGDISKVRQNGLLGFFFGSNADYVRQLGPLFLYCLALFGFSSMLGFYLGDVGQISALEEILSLLPDMEGSSFPFIFFTFLLLLFINNTVNSLMFMVLGVFFGVPSIYFIVVNGFVVGGVVYNTSLEVGLLITILSIVPHGLIEIPTILLSSAAGLSMGYKLITRLRGGNGLRKEFGRALRLFLYRILLLLFLAAIVEAMLIAAALSY